MEIPWTWESGVSNSRHISAYGSGKWEKRPIMQETHWLCLVSLRQIWEFIRYPKILSAWVTISDFSFYRVNAFGFLSSLIVEWVFCYLLCWISLFRMTEADSTGKNLYFDGCWSPVSQMPSCSAWCDFVLWLYHICPSELTYLFFLSRECESRQICIAADHGNPRCVSLLKKRNFRGETCREYRFSLRCLGRVLMAFL